MKQIPILLVLCCTVSLAYSQDYRQEADKCLEAGDYACAIKNLRLFEMQENTTQNVAQQINDAIKCSQYLAIANYAFEEKNYEKAAQQYNEILKLNPKDRNAKKQYDLCTAQGKPSGNLIDNVTGNQYGIDMVYVAGGTFTMGCTAEQGNDCYDSEKPAHRVTLSDFYIGKYEVTQAQWKAVMDSNPSYFKGDNLPVERVSWNDVQAFIRKINTQTGKNYRLPTEAEWEYACRGGARSALYKYSGSNTADNVAWYTENSGGQMHPAGQKLPNELGIYDMSGNVREWCSDPYGAYSSDSQTNPAGPSYGHGRVLRGGSLSSIEENVRVPYRYFNSPDFSYSNLGFRLASSTK
ncbi:MAG: SUMF1/EgtB/PvdO family nonheme iron enzyme [Dysgonamonadaceae bacterium]|jgi:formylglycine-generating enzyme required for sulfatase activity|nr:SUMF1/EgtB/PvdO family nonheme iron enzyme [Dysgonamonadaceae bacterium]